ncbi:hypothetical protein HPB47_019099, partial [Ixodes persulcatus]
RVTVLEDSEHTSYSIDDGAFFLADYCTATPQEVRKVRELMEGTGGADPEEDLMMPSTKKSAFLYLAGYLAASVLKNNVTYRSCRQAAVERQNTDEAVKFTLSKCYKDGAPTVPSKGLTALLLVSEAVFRRVKIGSVGESVHPSPWKENAEEGRLRQPPAHPGFGKQPERTQAVALLEREGSHSGREGP